MSTKTIKQRIAVVAVSALTAGVLSVMSAPVANAGVTVPTNLACTVGDAQITLTWTASTVTAGDTAISKYQYSTDAGPTYKDMPTAGTTATATTRTLTEISTAATPLINGTAYSITIKAVGGTTGAGTATAAIICTPGVPEPGQMFISTAPSTTGDAAQASGLSVGATSLGWISQTSTTATAKYSGLALSGSAAATGVVNSSAKIAFNATSTVTSLDSLGVVVTGGTISGFGCLNAGTGSLSGAATTAVCAQAGTTRSTAFGVFNVSAAVGSTATISIFKGTSITSTSTATNGDLVGSWTLTVAAANAAGTVNAANTTVAQQAGILPGVAASTTLTYDTASRMTNGSVGIVYVDIYDAYLSNVTTGTFTASSTAGTVNAVVAGSAATSDSYAATTTFDSVANSSGKFYVYVNQPVANTAGSSTVTMSLNGAVIGTKTLTWQGQAASIAVNSTSKKIFANGYAAYASADAKNLNINYTIKDAAGNNVTVATYPTLSDQTGSMVGASLSPATDTTAATATLAGVLTNLDVDAFAQTSSNGLGLGTMRIPSSTLSGAGSYTLSFVNASGATIKSTVQNVTVSRGATNTFTASWDKAAYAPGEIAKLTIKGIDAFGNAIADGTAATGLVRAVNSSGFTQVGTALSAASTFSAGEITETYAVGNTEGSYSFSVTLTAQSGQDPVVGTLVVKATTATVSNADVLKSIVALIASINKQIQALQKLILKR